MTQVIWKHLNIMNACRSHSKAPNKAMLGMNVDSVLIAVVIDPILFRLAGI